MIMAVTAIWDIKGRVDKVISYATNPQKTDVSAMQYAADLHAIERVVEYTADEMKTEKCCFVSGINCDPDQAAHQFVKSKKHWKKEGGIVAFHGYQSFRAGEVDADTAHQIGVALAKELWGDRFEVVVATHLNTDHYHNHFVINSVSLYDGYKYNDCKESYRRMREVSDRLCKEHNLSVIKYPQGKKKNYLEWSAQRCVTLTGSWNKWDIPSIGTASTASRWRIPLPCRPVQKGAFVWTGSVRFTPSRELPTAFFKICGSGFLSRKQKNAVWEDTDTRVLSERAGKPLAYGHYTSTIDSYSRKSQSYRFPDVR